MKEMTSRAERLSQLLNNKNVELETLITTQMMQDNEKCKKCMKLSRAKMKKRSSSLPAKQRENMNFEAITYLPLKQLGQTDDEIVESQKIVANFQIEKAGWLRGNSVEKALKLASESPVKSRAKKIMDNSNGNFNEMRKVLEQKETIINGLMATSMSAEQRVELLKGVLNKKQIELEVMRRDKVFLERFIKSRSIE